MKRNTILLALLGTLLTCSITCGCGGNKGPQKESNGASTKTAETADLSAGESLFMANCYSCHNPNTSRAARLAPSTAKVQHAYQDKYPQVDQFTAEMTTFLQNVQKEDAIMKNAVKQYGLMPQMSFTELEWNAMARYIHNTKFKEAEAAQQISIADMTPTEKGLYYAQSTKKQLGKNLMRSLQEGGPKHALSFCNVRAMPLTDSMAHNFGVSIKRVSDQPRNPDNLANQDELAAIRQLKEMIASDKKVNPIVKEESDHFRFYAPITTNGMCLQCHGTVGKDITPETTAKIDELYPQDKAKGYGSNQLRGIWSISFPKS